MLYEDEVVTLIVVRDINLIPLATEEQIKGLQFEILQCV
jgi:hypothetical protein